MIKLLLLILLLFSLFTSCKKTELKPLERADEIDFKLLNVAVDFCTMDPVTAQSNLKFIYVIDKSSSNQTNPGTDSYGSRRYAAINSFINEGINDDTIFYSLINFSDTSELMRDFTDRNNFEQTITGQHNLTNPPPPATSNDQGWTNYSHAIDRIKTLIVDDVNRAKEELNEIISTHYVIFFLSDGVPTDDMGNVLTEQQVQNVLMPKIDDIVSLETNPDNDFNKWIESIQLHTGYYHNLTINATAQRILEDMALRGNGQTHSFANGQTIEFSKFTLPERNVKHSLKDIFVVNANTVWDENYLKEDTDADGISNAKERTIGSDPYQADSDQNGVSDGVEYIASGKPCSDAGCSPAAANPFHSCTGYIAEGWHPGMQGKYIDQDGDLLNNCEERALLGSQIYKFDTNDDWIPDYLAFRSAGSISYLADPKISGRLLDADSDGVDNYHELKYNTPWNYDNTKMSNPTIPYNYSLIPTADYATKTCYRLNVSSISAYGDGNKIRIFILEKSAIIDNRRFMRVIERLATTTSLYIDLR